MALDPNTGIDYDIEPGPLPSPTPDPRVFINQYPAGYGAPSGGYIPPPAGIYDLVPPGGSLLDLMHGLGYTGPTEKFGRFLGGLLGGVSTSTLVPVPGSGIVGSRLGSWGGGRVTNWLQNLFGGKWPGIKPPAKPGKPGTPPSDSVDVGTLEDVTGGGSPMRPSLGPGYRGATSTIPGFGPGGSGTVGNTGITIYDIIRSGVTPRSVSSVQAPAGLMPYGPGSMLNLGNLWGGRAAQRSGPMTAAQWGNTPMGSGQAGGQLASFIAQNTRGSGPVPTYNSYANAWANAPNLAALLPQFSGEVNRGTPLRRST